uniref:Putative ORF3 protein n=1 Tax=Zaria bat coronavirus TaxID=989337 RepID=F1BYM0_9BETC|nr:putative ORF3 protein [Zaria bat coronavirus]
MDYFKFWSFGLVNIHKPDPVYEPVVARQSFIPHGTTISPTEHPTMLAGDICLTIFLLVYIISWFLRADSIPAVILRFALTLITGTFLVIGLFLEQPSLVLKIAVAVTIVAYVGCISLRLALAIRCVSWLPLMADDDCFVCYQSGGYNYCFPYDPNGPYVTLTVHNNGVTCGSHTIYGSVSVADRIQVVTIRNKNSYILQNTFDTGICIIAFYIADIAVVENHTVVGDLPKSCPEYHIYDEPRATINVPL